MLTCRLLRIVHELQKSGRSGYPMFDSLAACLTEKVTTKKIRNCCGRWMKRRGPHFSLQKGNVAFILLNVAFILLSRKPAGKLRGSWVILWRS